MSVPKKNYTLSDVFEVDKIYYFLGVPIRFCADGTFQRVCGGRGRPRGSSIYRERQVSIRVPVSLVPTVKKLKSELRKSAWAGVDSTNTDKVIFENIDSVIIR